MRHAGELTADCLALGGMAPFSMGDFPDRLSAVLFTQGCPLRCRYCHNPHLRPLAQSGDLTWGRAVTWLRRRRGLLDAVVISGGEPTIQAGLVEALIEIRTLGFSTGLHSSGANPNRLAKVLPLLDWIGLDFKAPFARYATITGSASSGMRARRSLHAVLGSGTPFEIRTTVHRSLLDEDDLTDMARELQRYEVRSWVLQVFRATGCEDVDLPQAGRPDWLENLLPSLQALVPEITVR
jgi:pyruvate formate lyase activating enzyme